MKKVIVLIFTIGLIFALLGCSSPPPPAAGGPTVSASAGRSAPGGFPPFVRDAIRNAPEDVLVGIGSARLANVAQSRTIATNRARAEIARQMESMVQDMIRDYQASSEVDPQAALSFQENITLTLSRADVSGARVVAQDMTADQTVWTVVWIDRASVAREINQAQAAARLAVPAMAAFIAEERMHEAFARQNEASRQIR